MKCPYCDNPACDYLERRKEMHGCHILDDEYVEGCKPCGERIAIKAAARLLGMDEKETTEALDDGAFCKKWGGGSDRHRN